MKRLQRTVNGFIVVTIFTTGCISPTSIQRLAGRAYPENLLVRGQSPDPQSSSAISDFSGTSQSRNFLSTPNDAFQKTRFGTASSSMGRKLVSAFNRTKESLSRSMKPKIVKAYDPTRLDSKPISLSAGVYCSTAILFERRGDHQKAKELYERALTVDADHFDTLIYYARHLDCKGQFEQATHSYQRATQVQPDNPSAFNDLGLCLARQGALEDSLTALRCAVALSPKSKLYRNNIATVLVKANRPNDALFDLVTVHGEAIGHYNLGYLLNNQGQLRAARFHFSTALAKDPTFQSAREMLARITLANRPLDQQAPAANWQPPEHWPPSQNISHAWRQSLPYNKSQNTPTTPLVVSSLPQQPAARPSSLRQHDSLTIQNTPKQRSTQSEPLWHNQTPMIRLPQRTLKLPARQRAAVPPLPGRDEFMFSNSVVQPLPTIRR